MKRFIALAAAAFVVLAAASVWLGGLNQDEGWYLYAAQLVRDGRMPYRDFFFTQGPLMPVVYSFLVPVFFCVMGMMVDITQLCSAPVLIFGAITRFWPWRPKFSAAWCRPCAAALRSRAVCASARAWCRAVKSRSLSRESACRRASSRKRFSASAF
jgi:hypothetical protein